MKIAMSLLALAGSASAYADIQTFDVFTPSVSFSEKSTGVYSSAIETTIVYNGEKLDIAMSADTALFAEDWSLETYDEAGNLVDVETDSTQYMCHYVGSVVGKKGSEVVMSVCDKAGMRGTIHTEDFSIEIQPTDETNRALSNLGPHMIYDLETVDMGDYQLDELQVPDSVATANMNRTDVGGMAAYNAQVTTASDTYRMSGQSNEASNTQSIISQANSRYTNTNIGNGNTLRMTIQTQVQNPSGWTHNSNMDSKLNNLGSYKQSNYASRDNVVGLTHFSYGGTIGLAWVNSMCDRYYSAGLNNVGFSSSDNNRGVLVAHEIGHNFAMQHDSNGQGGSGFVMWPSLTTSATSFSSYSISSFNANRNRYTCL